MAIRFASVLSNVKQVRTKNQQVVPKGHIPLYVGEQANKMKRYVVPLSYLSHPIFRDLLQRAEEEFGFNHSMGALTIPCSEELFFNLISELKC
ncbi:Auxin-responsive protein SAUR15 [Bienertia sinuspersici]